MIGFCAGGILNTALLNHLARKGDTRIHRASYAVTLLDFGQSAPIGAFSSARLLRSPAGTRPRKGLISARAMGSAFTWMRPNDLVWNYWVNNYLMGQDPPRLRHPVLERRRHQPARSLHGQFLDIFAAQPTARAGDMGLSAPRSSSTIKVPTYVTGAVTDHLTPWSPATGRRQLLGGDSTFVLSNAGHIASLVNPPGNPKATLLGRGRDRPGPAGLARQRIPHAGQLVGGLADWVSDKAGGGPAPASLGSDRHKPLVPAPGRYVRDLAPK